MSLGEDDAEWLEADGLGGFASGTASGIRTRRYHALLLVATRPPSGRMVLVNGFDATFISKSGRFPLSAQRYAPDVVAPDGLRRWVSFVSEPWPTWVFSVEDQSQLSFELFVPRGRPEVVLVWRLLRRGGSSPALLVRPFFSGRDYHALHHENVQFGFAPRVVGHDTLRFRLYDDVPAVLVKTNGTFEPEPQWYRRFAYKQEQDRGLDHHEDLAAPGLFRFDLQDRPAVLRFSAQLEGTPGPLDAGSVLEEVEATQRNERARRVGIGPKARAEEQYFVRRGEHQTIIAGYPWFTDWGRDTFIAMRGLCSAPERLAVAEEILLAWAAHVSEGMLPNRFPDSGEAPEYNAVDASLWYVVAVAEHFERSQRIGAPVQHKTAEILRAAVRSILEGYQAGTRYGIHGTPDGLLAAGAKGVQLTWMDAKVGSEVITPRSGKPVEVQALWLNALYLAAGWDDRFLPLFERGRAAFVERFWREDLGRLLDVVDVDHRPGEVDATFRPNQILAVGGLPLALVVGPKARRIVDAVESELFCPVGLRTLARSEPGYRGQYSGGPLERDRAYHQGTAWPWLLGPFVQAWLRVRGFSEAAKREARERFYLPLERLRREKGHGHLFEIADGDAPHTHRGCPSQAWSLGELLRIERWVEPGALYF